MGTVMFLAYGIASCVYVVLFLKKLTFFYQPRCDMRIVYTVAILADWALTWLFCEVGSVVLSYPLNILTIFIEFTIFFKYPYGGTLLPGIATMIYMMFFSSFASIGMAALTGFSGHSAAELLQNPMYIPLNMTVAFAASTFVITYFGRDENLLEKIETFKHNREITRFALICTLLVLCGEMAASQVFMSCPYDIRLIVLYSGFCLGASLILILVYAVCIRTAIVMDIEMKTRQLEDVRHEQMQNYRAYARLTQRVRSFQERYKVMMGTVYRLFANERYVAAKAEIDAINDIMQREVKANSGYSNNELLDAIMQSFGNRCEDQGIEMKAKIYVPEELAAGETDICRIFEIVSRKLEQLAKASGAEKPYIEFESRLRDEWVIVQGTCSCGERPAGENMDTDLEWAVNQAGGVTDNDYDLMNGTYSISVCFLQKKAEETIQEAVQPVSL